MNFSGLISRTYKDNGANSQVAASKQSYFKDYTFTEKKKSSYCKSRVKQGTNHKKQNDMGK